jgi:hypothetical protein
MRLLGLYGSEAVNICYPGARPMMDMQWPGDRGEPIAVKRPERKLIADIQKSDPEPELPLQPIVPDTPKETPKQRAQRHQAEV